MVTIAHAYIYVGNFLLLDYFCILEFISHSEYLFTYKELYSTELYFYDTNKIIPTQKDLDFSDDSIPI